MPAASDATVPELLSGAAAVAALVLAGVVVAGLAREYDAVARLRERFVLGVPWGTLAVVLSLVAVYLFVQGGWRHPDRPVVYAFPGWSYFYPFGMLASSFTHVSTDHLANNLLATVVFAPIAEYVWGHYPPHWDPGAGGSAADRDAGVGLEDPSVRIGAFVLAVVAVGVFESLFIPGPVIGFSGVAFALGAFVVVTAPVAAVFALVGTQVVRLAYETIRAPVYEATAQSTYWTPGWAGISIQGHAMGVLLGLLLGVYLLRRRGARREPWKVWFAVLVFAASKSLWAIYWQRGQSTYVLYRGIGLAVVVLLASIAALAAVEPDRRVHERFDLTWGRAGVGLLVACVLVIALVAVPYNAIALTESDVPDDGVVVEDYVVAYDENVTDSYVAGTVVPFLADRVSIRTGGVIVASPDRNAWFRVMDPDQLAHEGSANVTVGGIGWRETVVVDRTNWDVHGGEEVYRVTIQRPGEPPRHAFASEPEPSHTVVDGRAFRIQADAEGFAVTVVRNGSDVGTVRVPDQRESATVDGVTVVRRGDRLFVERGETRVLVATKEDRLRPDLG